MTLFPFRSVTLEPLEGFRRPLTQMLTRLRWCAEAMFRMAGIKVILRGQKSLWLCFPIRSVALEPLEGFRRNLTQIFTRLRDYLQKQCSGWLASRSRSYLGVKGHMTLFPFCSVTLEPLEGFRRPLTQMFTRLRWCAEAMFRMAGFKVKVRLRGSNGHMTLFPFRSVTLEPLEGFRRNLTQMFTTLRRHAKVKFRIAHLQGEGHT